MGVGLGGGGVLSGSESFQNQDSTTKGEATEPQKQTSIEKWLFARGMGAAREFRDLDFVAARDDFERLSASGANPGAIVKIWRVAPPTAPAGEESRWAKYARENPSLYRLGSDEDGLDDDQADDQGDEQ
jgi:hypothetical protein